MIYGLFLITILSSFFLLFKLCRNDLIIVRQNISLASIFDKSIVMVLLAAIISRIFFIIEQVRFDYLNILKFFYITRYPGFSVIGFYIGMFFILGFIFRSKKNISRIYDLFFLSFYPFVIFSLCMLQNNPHLFLLKIIFVFMSILFFPVLFSVHKNYRLKDGSVTIVLLLFTFLIIILSEFAVEGTVRRTLTFPHVVDSFLFIVFLSLFIINQKIVKKR